MDYGDDETFRYYSNNSSHRMHRSESRSSRRSDRSSSRRHREHKEDDRRSSRHHKKLSRTNSDWMDRLSVGHTRGDHMDYGIYNGHQPLEQTRSDTSSEMHFSPKPRIYKVKSLDLKPEGHYKKASDGSADIKAEPSSSRRMGPKERTRHSNVSRERSPEASAYFADPAEVIKRKAIELIEAELERHSSSLAQAASRIQLPETADRMVLNKNTEPDAESALQVGNEKRSVIPKSPRANVKAGKPLRGTYSVENEPKANSERKHIAPPIELTKRTPSGHFSRVSLDDDRPAKAGSTANKSHHSSRETSPESSLHFHRSYHEHCRRSASWQGSREGSQRSSREHSRPVSPHNKNPMKDSAYQSHEQSTEKTTSRPASNTVSPKLSLNVGRKVGKPRSRDDSAVHYTSRPTRYAHPYLFRSFCHTPFSWHKKCTHPLFF